MARAAQQPATSMAWLIIALGVAGIGGAFYYGYPGMGAMWLAVVAAGWAEPRPVFTGPKDSYGAPAPQGPKERSAKNRYLLLNDLRWRMLVPNGDWMPGWPPLAAWVMAVAAGVLATALPVSEELWAWVNGGATFILATQLPASMRRTKTPVDPHPGVRLNSLGKINHLRAVFISAVLAALAAALLSLALLGGVLTWLDLVLPGIAYAASLAAMAGIGVCWGSWQGAALTTWRQRVAARNQWEPRWQVAIPSVAKTGTPTQIAHRTIGGLTIDTFDAPPTLGASGLIALKPKVVSAIGGGVAVTMAPTPNLDSSGQPMPGTEHPLRVDVVTYPTDSPPDVTDPAMSQEEAAYMISAALSQAVDAFGSGGAQYVFIDIEPIHVPPAVEEVPTGWSRLWASAPKAVPKQPEPADDSEDEDESAASPMASSGAVWALRYGGANTLHYARTQYAGMMPGHLGQHVQVLVNSWPENDPHHPGGGRLYTGAITDPGTVYADPSMADMLANLMAEDTWNTRWSRVVKTGVNQPEPQFATAASGNVRVSEINSLAFTIKQGQEVAEFMKLEPKLATTLTAAPFVSIVGYPGPGGRPGDRHPQAFAVRWSNGPVPPSADHLAPGRETSQRASTITTPEHWVLAGHLNAAFDAARLARPEVMSVRPLTKPGGNTGHIWQVEARMYGGVSLTEVRTKMGKIASTLSVPWLQVTPSKEAQCLVFVMGADYRKARLANPERDLGYLTDLEWQQAWVDAKLISPQGLAPTTIATNPLPTNDKVFALDFELPSGITRSRVKGAVDKLKGSTRNEFVEVRPGEHGPNSVRLLVCEEDPMPFPAAIDFDFVHSDASAGLIPFATGVEGEPISWNIEEDPHLLCVGASGSGKTAVIQMLLYPMIERGWEVHIADPIKAGADFRFAAPWLQSLTFTVEETSAMMDAVYAEVQRRRNLNGEYGVGSYRDLPEDVRPPHSVIIIDEFTSLILADKPRKPTTSDPDAMAEYEEAVRTATLVGNIGSKVARISREARSAGVTLVLATQRLTAKELDAIPGGNTIRTNMSRILLGKSTLGERQSALKDYESAPDLGDVVPQGRGLIEISGSPIRIVQSWYDHPIDEVLTARLQERVTPLPEDEKLDLEPFMSKAEEMVIEGAVLDVPAPVPGPAEVTGLDVMELDLEDLELSGEDFSDLEEGDEDVTEMPMEAAATGTDVPAPLPGEPVLATDHPEVVRVLGIATVWLGEEGSTPPGVQVADGGDGLLRHRHLDALAALLTRSPSHLVWVSSAVSDRDDLGTPLVETVTYLADSAGGVPVLTLPAFDEDQVRGFLGHTEAAQSLPAIPETDWDPRPQPVAPAPTGVIEELNWDDPETEQMPASTETDLESGLEELPAKATIELGENEEEFSF